MAIARQIDDLGDLRDCRRILVETPNLHAQRDAVCGELLSGADPERTNALMVLLDASPDAAVERWRTHATSDPPAKMGVITTTEQTRSAAGPGGVSTTAPSLRIETVPDPGNLTTLGVRITDCLSTWEGDRNRPVVCFDSLSTLLQYVDRQQAFQFLHTLTGWLAHHDGIAHYHLDPTVIDDQTTNTMETLMDALITIDADGEIALSTR